MKDLGILMINELKPTNRINKAASKEKYKLDILKGTFIYRRTNNWIKLYKSYVLIQKSMSNLGDSDTESIGSQASKTSKTSNSSKN